eukprot:m.358896 g.358896  ORF g.358896 m.358896 type:complete len:102 (-) comp16621_c0_seq1:396-701(-)
MLTARAVRWVSSAMKAWCGGSPVWAAAADRDAGGIMVTPTFGTVLLPGSVTAGLGPSQFTKSVEDHEPTEQPGPGSCAPARQDRSPNGMRLDRIASCGSGH